MCADASRSDPAISWALHRAESGHCKNVTNASSGCCTREWMVLGSVYGEPQRHWACLLHGLQTGSQACAYEYGRAHKGKGRKCIRPGRIRIRMIKTEEELEDALSRPTPEDIASARDLAGDVLILGVGGKMGPSLARLLRRALEACGSPHRVIGVARFSDAKLKAELDRDGIETVACDLLEPM